METERVETRCRAQIYALIQFADETDAAIARGETPPVSVRQAQGRVSGAPDSDELTQALDELPGEYGDDLRLSDRGDLRQRPLQPGDRVADELACLLAGLGVEDRPDQGGVNRSSEDFGCGWLAEV